MPMSIATEMTVSYKDRGMQAGRRIKVETELDSFVSRIEDKFPCEILLQAMSLKASHEICVFSCTFL